MSLSDLFSWGDIFSREAFHISYFGEVGISLVASILWDEWVKRLEFSHYIHWLSLSPPGFCMAPYPTLHCVNLKSRAREEWPFSCLGWNGKPPGCAGIRKDLISVYLMHFQQILLISSSTLTTSPKLLVPSNSWNFSGFCSVNCLLCLWHPSLKTLRFKLFLLFQLLYMS